MGDGNLAARVAGLECWVLAVPGLVVFMLHTECLDFKAHHAGEVGGCVPVVQDVEAQVVVQVELDVLGSKHRAGGTRVSICCAE